MIIKVQTYGTGGIGTIRVAIRPEEWEWRADIVRQHIARRTRRTVEWWYPQDWNNHGTNYKGTLCHPIPPKRGGGSAVDGDIWAFIPREMPAQ